MGNLVKIPSAVQVLIAEIVATWGLSSFVMAVCNTVRPGAFGDMSLLGVGNWVWYLLGFALAWWSFMQIWHPHVGQDSWVDLNTGTDSGGAYGFCSTHPSYLGLDLVNLFMNALIFLYALSSNIDARHFAILTGVALVFPLLRLFAWYILGRQLPPDLTWDAWKPAACVFVPMFGVGVLVIRMAQVVTGQTSHMAVDIPMMDGKAFTREQFSRLVDAGDKDHRTVRLFLRTVQISEAPMTCINKEKAQFATVLAQLGDGDVLIVASSYAGGGFDNLMRRASHNQGRPIEVVGRLGEMPARAAIASWKNFCGLDTLPPPPAGGRWVLEVDAPEP